MSKAKSLVKALTKKPGVEKGSDKPFIPLEGPNFIHQVDLLFLPEDQGYKYALVATDVGTRLVDAVPLKSKQPKGIIDGLKTIHTNGILEKPFRVHVDSGTEFKGDVKKWLTKNEVKVKTALPGRHRQQAIVENRNKQIGKKLFNRMIEEELQTGEQSNQWIDDLPLVIEEINDKTKERTKLIRKSETGNPYKCKGTTCDLYPIGTRVHVALDAPRDSFGKKLAGNFRETDLRFSLQPKTIVKILTLPYQPPLYVLDGQPHTAYTKQQLLPYKERKLDEQKIRPKKNDKDENVWIVEKIIDKRKLNNRLQLKVKWKGFKQPTWEPRSVINKDVPELVKEFEDSLR